MAGVEGAAPESDVGGVLEDNLGACGPEGSLILLHIE